MVVDLAGDVALETAHDVELGQPLFGPPLDIGSGRWVAAHPDQGNAPQGVVGLAVTAAVESVAVGAARGRRDRGGAAKMGEGGLAAEPMGIVTGGHQQLPGGVDPNPGQGDQGRRGRGDQQLELSIKLSELGLELLPAASQGPQARLGRGYWAGQGPGRIAAQTPTRALVLSPSSG